MIPNETPQTLSTNGEGIRVVGNFRITDATQARIMMSLSDKIYTKKEMAVIREYSTNMLDAMTAVGKSVSDCIITLPTYTDFNLKFRDFGEGLTEDELVNIFCVFGESTKRHTDKFVGMLGFGSKAGYSVTDSFTVTSWVNGEKSIYQCVKGDNTRLHEALLLSRTPSNEPSGIEIGIPVKQSSMWTFHGAAVNFFKYWEILPNLVNLECSYQNQLDKFRNTPATLKGEGWNIRPKSSGSATGVAFMGGVSYEISWNVISDRMALDSKKRVLFDLLQNNDVTLFFEMGQVNFVDSRENLEYTDYTLKALMVRIESIFKVIADSIQEKFAPAATLWDAKIIYNAIFGTGLLEVERGENSDCVDRIKILDGNLMALERTFAGEFSWNNITLSNALFDDINRFDNCAPGVVHDAFHTPNQPVMCTYRRKRQRVKIGRCNSEKNNTIVASNQVAVVVNDSGIKSNQSAVARYLIFKENKIKTVHVLNFADAASKNTFYKELNFDTVPVIMLSDVVADAKAWVRSNKDTRSYGGGGGGHRAMTYMEISSDTIEEHDVPIRSIEEGGIYIEEADMIRTRRRLKEIRNVRLGDGYRQDDPASVLSGIKCLIDNGGLDIDRIYIINKQTLNSKWFVQAKTSGDWENVFEYIKDNLDVDVQSLVDTDAINGIRLIGREMFGLLEPKIIDKNSPIRKLIVPFIDTGHVKILNIVDSLKYLQVWDAITDSVKSKIDSKEIQNIKANYPYIDFTVLGDENHIDDAIATKLARYINATDIYVDLIESTSIKNTATEAQYCLA